MCIAEVISCISQGGNLITMKYNNNIRETRRTTRKSVGIKPECGGEGVSGAAPRRHKINIIVSIFCVSTFPSCCYCAREIGGRCK